MEHTAAGPSAIVQIAYVQRPEFFEASLRHWTEVVGAGPFYIDEPVLSDQLYRGVPSNSTCRLAMGYFGDTQIELISPTNSEPSVFGEWIETTALLPCQGRVHHVMVWNDDREVFERTLRRYLDAGCTTAFSGRVEDGRRLYYLDSVVLFGHFIELLEPGPTTPVLFARMSEAHRSWDGTRPTRPIGELSERLD